MQNSLKIYVVALLFLASLASAPAAQTAWTNGSLGDWFIATNWSNGVPNLDQGTDGVIANSGTALVTRPLADAPNLFVGVPTGIGSTGTLLLAASGQSIAGYLSVPGVIIIGRSITATSSNGTLNISGGARLEGNELSIGYGTQASNGSFTISDAISSASVVTLYVGRDAGQGAFTVQSGGWLHSSDAVLAQGSGSSGSATVTGNGSVILTDRIFIGGSGASNASGGTGALHILSGGQVQTSLLKQFSTGFVEVDNGSSVTPGLIVSGVPSAPVAGGSLGDFAVGNNGTGRMEITAGGQVYTSRGFMGGNAGSNGTAVLSGTGSEWICNGSVYVGNSGEGTLTVDSNALLSSAGNGYIAFNNNAVGYATVSSGGRWNTAGTLYIGGNGGGPGGSGTLLVENGTLNAGAYVLHNTGGVIIASDSLRGPNDSHSVPTTINGGYIQAGTGAYFSNACTLGADGVRFYTAGNLFDAKGALTGSGGVTKGGSALLGAGILILSGTSNYTGPTSVTTGTLLVRGSITSAVTVSNGGKLGGNGSVGNVILNNNGTLAPGEIYVGKLTVNGNYTQTAGGLLEIELWNPVNTPPCDQVAITGTASVNGTLKVSDVPGFRPQVGTTYPIITSNGLTGNFAIVNSPGLILSSDPSPSGIVLTVIGYSPSVASSGSLVVSAGPNGVLDPGETVTVSLGALNNAGPGGGCTTPALTGTLEPGGGVTDPSVPQTYGSLCSVSPGASRTFTFTVDPSLVCGDVVTASLAMMDGEVDYGTLTYSFRVGSLIPIAAENFDGPIAPALPDQWTSAATGGETPWVSSTTTPFTAPNAAFAPESESIGTSELISPTFEIPAEGAKLKVKTSYNTERNFDGMVLEISINGDPYLDIIDAGGSFQSGGYSGVISNDYGSPIAGRPAWTGNSLGYVSTVVTLPATAMGQSVQLKWLSATDTGGGGAGARIDDVSIALPVCGGSAPVVTSAASRKVHGASGAFDINLPLTGSPAVECRNGGPAGSYQVVATFASPVSVQSVAIASSDGLATTIYSVSGSIVTVDLAAVTNAQTLAITLVGTGDGTNVGNVVIPMGVLIGDTSGNGSVNASDVSQTKSKSGQAVDTTNFRTDVTVSNSINAGDVGIVKVRAGTALP